MTNKQITPGDPQMTHDEGLERPDTAPISATENAPHEEDLDAPNRPGAEGALLSAPDSQNRPGDGEAIQDSALKHDLISRAISWSCVNAESLDELDESILLAAAAMRQMAPRDLLDGILAAEIWNTLDLIGVLQRRANAPGQPIEVFTPNVNALIKAKKCLLAQIAAYDTRRGRGQPQLHVAQQVNVQASGLNFFGPVEAHIPANDHVSRSVRQTDLNILAAPPKVGDPD